MNICSLPLPEHFRPSFSSWLEKHAMIRLNKNPNLEQYFIFSLVWTIHQMILKHQLDGSLKGIFTLLPPNSQQSKLMKIKFWEFSQHSSQKATEPTLCRYLYRSGKDNFRKRDIETYSGQVFAFVNSVAS